MSDYLDVQDAEDLLASLPRFADQGGRAYRPGLDRIERMLREMGNPHEAYPCVHVAGTNGKGSTASMIASIGTAAGLSIGLHTSPHLFHVSERLRIDGQPAPRRWLADAVRRHRRLFDGVGPSYFEALVALSLLYFAESDVDAAVVETGMGGRLDATNVILPRVSVITDIGLDHVEHLGETVEAIAAEKAGIIKEGVPVVTGGSDAAFEVIRRTATARHAVMHRVQDEVELLRSDIEIRGSSIIAESPLRTYPDLFVGLAGRHQIRNALTAVRSAELAFDAVAEHARPVYEGLRHVGEWSGLRGRLEVLREHPVVIVDVAHNVDGLAAALGHLGEIRRREGRLEILLGVMRDKDVRAMCPLLKSPRIRVHPVSVKSERALPARELAVILKGCGTNVAEPCTVAEGVESFLSEASRADTLLITGSHLVAAQLAGTVL